MEDTQSLLARASAAAGGGDKLGAESLLDELVVTDPGNERAGLLLSQVANDPEKVGKCLRQVLAIRPDNLAASERWRLKPMAKANGNPPSKSISSTTRPRRPIPSSPAILAPSGIISWACQIWRSPITPAPG